MSQTPPEHPALSVVVAMVLFPPGVWLRTKHSLPVCPSHGQEESLDKPGTALYPQTGTHGQHHAVLTVRCLRAAPPPCCLDGPDAAPQAKRSSVEGNPHVELGSLSLTHGWENRTWKPVTPNWGH